MTERNGALSPRKRLYNYTQREGAEMQRDKEYKMILSEECLAKDFGRKVEETNRQEKRAPYEAICSL